MHICVWVRTSEFLCVRAHSIFVCSKHTACLCGCEWVCMCVSACVYVCMYVCTFMCACFCVQSSHLLWLWRVISCCLFARLASLNFNQLPEKIMSVTGRAAGPGRDDAAGHGSQKQTRKTPAEGLPQGTPRIFCLALTHCTHAALVRAFQLSCSVGCLSGACGLLRIHFAAPGWSAATNELLRAGAVEAAARKRGAGHPGRLRPIARLGCRGGVG